MAEEVARSVLRFAAWLVIDGLGYLTARLLFPLISFGWVKVDGAPHGTVSHNWFGFRRAADGAVLLQSCTASMLGLFSWFLWLALVLAIVR